VTPNRKVLSLAEAERRGVVMERVPSSCEWDGGCDRQTAALRWSHAQGDFLAACLLHATVREEPDETQESADRGAQPAQDREMDAPLSRGGGPVARETPRRTPNGEPRTATTSRRTRQPQGWRMAGRGFGRADLDDAGQIRPHPLRATPSSPPAGTWACRWRARLAKRRS
jgi:hypothetical protein